MKKIISIDGMTCGNCKTHVTNALGELEGVTSVDVNLEDKMATVESENEIDDETLKNTVSEAGYSATAVTAG